MTIAQARGWSGGGSSTSLGARASPFFSHSHNPHRPPPTHSRADSEGPPGRLGGVIPVDNHSPIVLVLAGAAHRGCAARQLYHHNHSTVCVDRAAQTLCRCRRYLLQLPAACWVGLQQRPELQRLGHGCAVGTRLAERCELTHARQRDNAASLHHHTCSQNSRRCTCSAWLPVARRVQASDHCGGHAHEQRTQGQRDV